MLRSIAFLLFCNIAPAYAKCNDDIHTCQSQGTYTIRIKGSSTNIIIPPAGKHDITTMKDTIVNPANTMLQHGGGVAAAISKATGPKLQKWSDNLPVSKAKPHERVPLGQAVISPAFNLEQRGINYIVHTVGPDMRIPEQEEQGDELLYDAWYNALKVAAEHDSDIQDIYFPSISTGIFKFDKNLAGKIALQAVVDFIREHPNRFHSITILLWPDTHDAYIKAINKIK
jgi:O-acetyl-ADP-ribose deacetylase (regulator of RNase III)